MSSPFSLKTKRGTEETIEAIERTTDWAHRIDTKNDATEIDTDFIKELNQEEQRLRTQHKIKTTETAIDNFVFNEREETKAILCGNLDEKSNALRQLKEYINEEFGYVEPPQLNKENRVWLIAQEVQRQQERIEQYKQLPVSNAELSDLGQTPEHWQNEEYPIKP